MFVAPRPLNPSPNRQKPTRLGARWATLGLALGAGLAAALLAFVLVRSRTASGPAAPELISVVIAARDIPARTRLTAGLLQVRRVSPADAPEGTIASPAELVGRVVLNPVLTGKAILTPIVAAPGAALGMAFSLPPSQRAVTVALDPADGVDEFARPGDHVDILATDEPGSGPAESRTVLQNVALLAVGSQTSSEDAAVPAPATGAGASHVTVAVSPLQAQALVLAAARGKIHLALRPADDDALAALPVFPAPARPVEAAPSVPKSRPRTVTRPAVVVPPPISTPMSPLPVMLSPSHVTITVIKGSQSQTVSVVP